MTLNQLKQSILNKQSIESKVKDLEIEKASFERQLSILSQEMDHEIIELNKLEKNRLLSFLPNYENKIFEQEDIIRKIKRKITSIQYNYDLLKIDLNKQIQFLHEININEETYEQELNHQISLLNNQEYEQIKKENQHFLITIDEGNKIIECLKKMDFFYNRGGNYQTIEKRFTLGNTTWIMGNPTVDVRNLKKVIISFENLLNQINHFKLKNDIELYFKNSKEFFDYAVTIIGADLIRNEYYSIKVIDFKRDVSNVLNRIRMIYQENLNKEKDLRNQLEEFILKAE